MDTTATNKNKNQEKKEKTLKQKKLDYMAEMEKQEKVDKSHGLNTLMKKNKMKSSLDIAPHFLNVFNFENRQNHTLSHAPPPLLPEI